MNGRIKVDKSLLLLYYGQKYAFDLSTEDSSFNVFIFGY